jgi:hypothetical protein
MYMHVIVRLMDAEAAVTRYDGGLAASDTLTSKV